MKICVKCNKNKSLTMFGKSKTSICKACRYKNYKYKPESGFKINLKRYYGITIEDYLALQEKQQNKCAICNKEETGIYWRTNAVKRLSVDHSHSTGQIRGLLCTNCNHGLGKFFENTKLLEKAAEYLKRYNQSNKDKT